MKTIRSLMTLAGVSLALLTLCAAGVRAQDAPSLSITNFAGEFTLANNAQWGNMVLPAGNYTLHYGSLFGSPFVEVRGTAKGSPHGVIRAESTDQSSATKSALVGVREGNTLIIRALEMPQLGKSIAFAMPRGAKLVAQNGKQNGYTQLAEAPMLIQRIPITLNAK